MPFECEADGSCGMLVDVDKRPSSERMGGSSGALADVVRYPFSVRAGGSSGALADVGKRSSDLSIVG